MKIKVINEGYYVSEDLTNRGLIDKNEFELSFVKFLVVGDVWESIEEGHWNKTNFKCLEGKWEGEENDGWWEYEGNEHYFEVI